MAPLGNYTAAAVLRAEDLSRAKRFYADVLGLKATAAGPTGEAFFAAGDGARVMVYERPGLPAPQNTTLGFGVPPEQFDTVVDDLRAKGVTFEEYDVPEMGLKTVNGVAQVGGVKVAWFKDSEGNILNIASM